MRGENLTRSRVFYAFFVTLLWGAKLVASDAHLKADAAEILVETDRLESWTHLEDFIGSDDKYFFAIDFDDTLAQVVAMEKGAARKFICLASPEHQRQHLSVAKTLFQNPDFSYDKKFYLDACRWCRSNMLTYYKQAEEALPGVLRALWRDGHSIEVFSGMRISLLRQRFLSELTRPRGDDAGDEALGYIPYHYVPSPNKLKTILQRAEKQSCTSVIYIDNYPQKCDPVKIRNYIRHYHPSINRSLTLTYTYVTAQFTEETLTQELESYEALVAPKRCPSGPKITRGHAEQSAPGEDADDIYPTIDSYQDPSLGSESHCQDYQNTYAALEHERKALNSSG